MLRRWLPILLVLWAGLMVVIAQGMRGMGGAMARKSAHLRLERAVAAVEANLDGLSDAGYVRWTPTAAARVLAATLTAAEAPPADDAPAVDAAALRAAPALQYVVGGPSGPWHVVLVPDDAHGTLHVDAYGSDPTHPLIARTLRVDAW